MSATSNIQQPKTIADYYNIASPEAKTWANTTEGLVSNSLDYNPLDFSGNALRSAMDATIVPNTPYTGTTELGADIPSMYTEGLNKNNVGGQTDWSMKGLGGTALGAGQLGLGVLSYLDQSKTADKQRKLMDQQMAQNTFVLNNAKGRQADIAATFGKA